MKGFWKLLAKWRRNRRWSRMKGMFARIIVEVPNCTRKETRNGDHDPEGDGAIDLERGEQELEEQELEGEEAGEEDQEDRNIEDGEGEILSFDAGLERFGYGETSDIAVPETVRATDVDFMNGGEVKLEEGDFVDGIISMSQAIRRSRLVRGRKSYYDMDVIHRGLMTGVEIKFMGDFDRVLDGSIISTHSAFADAQAKILLAAGNDRDQSVGEFDGGREGLNEPGNNGRECDGGVSVVRRPPAQEQSRLKNVIPVVNNEEGNRLKKDIYECGKWENLFSRKGLYERHI